MDTLRPFYPRRQDHVGQVGVPVTVANVLDPTRTLRFDAMVDTGAFGLVLPAAWRASLGPPSDVTVVDIETADQRIVPAELSGPVRIEIAGFRRIVGEVVFLEMQPTARGYEPLLGYTVLELAGAVVDMVTHRLVARKCFDVKPVSRSISTTRAPDHYRAVGSAATGG